MLTPENQAKIREALRPTIETLVEDTVRLVVMSLQEQLLVASPSAPPAATRPKPPSPSRSNGRQRRPQRTRLTELDRQTLSYLQGQSRFGREVKTGELREIFQASRTSMQKSLQRLIRYGLVRKLGASTKTAYQAT